ncbi:MAG: phosphoribosylglycinamide formyltransferase [Ignavibacteriae bacterium]|nr:phosphoribosylglycinamide formyltransferase [Ignavibacteriota bacterium]
MVEKLNIAVFASGKGSNFKALLDAITAGKIGNAEIVLLISNNSYAGALVIAREHNIPAIHLNRKQFETDETWNKALLKTLNTHGVNFIALSGYMKKLDSAIVKAFKSRIVNIHPALLPAFGGRGMYGIHVHEAVLASKAKVSGATVHIVDEEYDHGPIVLQRTVEVNPNDTPESLSAKVLEIEHQLYPEAIRLFAEGKVKVNGQRVMILN